MTELIVALDGPNPLSLAADLYRVGVFWFKLGPQALILGVDSLDFRREISLGVKLFLDLKLADTRDTCREVARHAAKIGVAALSTYTTEATEAALEGAIGTDLRIWRVGSLTDGTTMPIYPFTVLPHGVTCPVASVDYWKGKVKDIVCPGIRRPTDPPNGHLEPATPRQAVEAGATHIVVGRPIWAAPDPVAAAREILADLS